MAYAENPIIRRYMNRVAVPALEKAVGHMWSQILRLYFSVDNFGIERETYVGHDSKIRANLIVSNLRAGNLCQFLFLECKRPVKGDPTEHHWSEAHGQLKNYMVTSSASRPRFAQDLYGVVSIGRRIRFYVMRAGSSSLDSLESGNFGVVTSKYQIEHILQGIAQLAG